MPGSAVRGMHSLLVASFSADAGTVTVVGLPRLAKAGAEAPGGEADAGGEDDQAGEFGLVVMA